MLQRVVQNGFIHSFKPTSTNEIYKKLAKGICEIYDEHFDSEHECSHNGFSLLILHPEMKDVLMVFVYQKEKQDDQEESVKDDDMGKKVRELDICEDQITYQVENLKYKEEYPNMVEKEKILNQIGKMHKAKVRNRKKERKT